MTDDPNELVKWHDQLVAWRQTLCERLLECRRRSPDAAPLKLAILRIDRDLGLAPGVTLPWTPLDDLIAQAGYPEGTWLGHLPDVERRIAKLAKISTQSTDSQLACAADAR